MTPRAPGMTPPASADRDGERTALRLAHLHLRCSMHALARVELETLAGADRLDRDAVLDLAEVRWRTGDLQGASAAAAAWLAEGGAGEQLVLAHVISAEAAADHGLVDEAAAHVEAAAAGLVDRAALDAILAGIAARAAWPWEADPPPDPLPDAPRALPAAGAPTGEPPPPISPAPGPGPAPGAPPPPPAPATRGATELALAAGALIADEPGRAAVLLALAVRADPAVAEAVLATLDAMPPAPGQDAPFMLVRAEALHAAGRHEEARIAYASAERLALAPAEAGPPGSPQ